VDLGEFSGTWYRIAANPIIFEPKGACVRQILTPGEDGKIDVRNTYNKDDVQGAYTEIRGTAVPKDPSDSKLTVDFGFHFKGDYYIIGVGPQYQWAVVTDRFGYSLYIMSKKPTLDQADYQDALKTTEAAKVGISRLVAAPQEGCVYPN
jgi:apolipoprotein D and lipocalin family protein